MKPSIRHHYKGAKMALWLDLIPRLHKTDNLDPRYHRLDNSDILTTFESEGTRLIGPDEMWTTTLTIEDHPDSHSHGWMKWSSTMSMHPTTTTPLVSSSAGPLVTQWSARKMTTWATYGKRPTLYPSSIALDYPEELDESSGHPSTTDNKLKTDIMTDNTSLSLSVTISVGCCLLVLNILIFVAMYYQKDRMRRERRMMKRELDQEQEMLAHIDAHCGRGGGAAATAVGDHIKTCLSHDMYINCNSSTSPAHIPAIPPLPPAVFVRNHSLQHPQHASPGDVHSAEVGKISRPVLQRGNNSQAIYANVGHCSPSWCPIDAFHEDMHSNQSQSNNGGALQLQQHSAGGMDTHDEKTIISHGNPSTVV